MPTTPQIVDPHGRPVASWWFYRAAEQRNRDRTWIPFDTVDARKTADSFTRTQLLSHARYLYNNVGFIKAVTDDLARFSVGEGIELQSQCDDESARDEYEAYWREVFSLSPEVTGTQCLVDLLKNASRCIDRDGDLGFALTDHDDGEPCLQAFEAHEIGGVQNDRDRDRTIDGVQVDKRMRPVGYNVKTSKDKVRLIPRGQFLHLFEPTRFTQTRGLTAYHHAIDKARDVLDILNYETKAVKENSAIGMAITQLGDDGVGGGFFDKATTTTNSDGTSLTTEKLRGGAIPRLQPGEDIKSFESKRPGSTFSGFLDYLDADVANGIGLALAFVRAYRDGNGTAQRFILQKCQRKFNERTFLLSRLLKQTWFYVIGTKIDRGELPSAEGWWRVGCQYPSKITVDVGREAQQNREDLKYGNRTLAEDLSERGKDWETHRIQRKREAADLIRRARELAKEEDIPFETALNLMQSPDSPIEVVSEPDKNDEDEGESRPPPPPNKPEDEDEEEDEE